MNRWLSSFTGFRIPNYLVVTWSPEHSYLGEIITVFQCYILPSLTVVHHDIFLNNPPFVLTLIQLHTYLPESWQGSYQIYISHPIESSIQLISPPSHKLDGKTKQDRYFTKWYGVLGGVTITKEKMPHHKAMQVIEWSVCVFTRITSFLYQDRTLLIFPAARSQLK